MYGVDEFLTTLGVQDQKYNAFEMNKTNSSSSNNSQFYEYLQNKKIAIVNAFSKKSVASPQPQEIEICPDSDNFSIMDLHRSISSSTHGNDINGNKKYNGNTGNESKNCFKHPVNSIAVMEIAANNMNNDFKNPQVSQSHAASRHPRGSSSKLFNVLGKSTLIALLSYVMCSYVMCSYVMLCYVMLCYVLSCYVMLCFVTLCYVMLCYVVLCNIISCYVMLCYVVLCHVM